MTNRAELERRVIDAARQQANVPYPSWSPVVKALWDLDALPPQPDAGALSSAGDVPLPHDYEGWNRYRDKRMTDIEKRLAALESRAHDHYKAADLGQMLAGVVETGPTKESDPKVERALCHTCGCSYATHLPHVCVVTAAPAPQPEAKRMTDREEGVIEGLQMALSVQLDKAGDLQQSAEWRRGMWAFIERMQNAVGRLVASKRRTP